MAKLARPAAAQAPEATDQSLKIRDHGHLEAFARIAAASIATSKLIRADGFPPMP